MSLNTKFAQYHRPKTDAPGPPTVGTLGAADAGLLAINFAGHTAAEKTAGKVAIYSFNGSTWDHLNDVAAISTQTISLVDPASLGAADIGAAYALGTVPLTGDVIIATYGSPAGAFLLTNKGLPGAAASWTSLGSATATASSAEASAGTDNAKMITAAAMRAEIERLLANTAAKTGAITTKGGNGAADTDKILVMGATGILPAAALPIATQAETQTGSADDKLSTPLQLRTELARALGISVAALLAGTAGINAGGGVAGNAGKFPLLDANGRLDASFFNIKALNFLGAADFGAAIPTLLTPKVYASGDVYFANADGTPLAAWGFGAGVTVVKSGDMALFDGTVWHHLDISADLSHVVLKDGANTMTKDANLIWEAAGAIADAVLIDGNDAANAVMQNFNLKNCTLNGGTF